MLKAATVTDIRCHLRKRIDTLTPDDLALLPIVRDEWIANALRTDAMSEDDRRMAAEAVCGMHRVAGLAGRLGGRHDTAGHEHCGLRCGGRVVLADALVPQVPVPRRDARRDGAAHGVGAVHNPLRRSQPSNTVRTTRPPQRRPQCSWPAVS
jgi:hypothetical protein